MHFENKKTTVLKNRSLHTLSAIAAIFLVAQPAMAKRACTIDEMRDGIVEAADRLAAKHDINLKATGANAFQKVIGMLCGSASYEHLLMPVTEGTATASFRIGRMLGRGIIGSVHEVQIENANADFIAAHPELFHGQEARTDLVAKLPNPIPAPVRTHWRNGILKEIDQENKVLNALEQMGSEQFSGPRILMTAKSTETFLIKEKVSNVVDVEKILASGGLSEEQKIALKSQIYDKAEMLFTKFNLTVDLRRENLYWDPTVKEWHLFEVSLTPQPSRAYIGSSFNDLLTYLSI